LLEAPTIIITSDIDKQIVISRFTCASLTEDRYGVVQRDIPRILEAFLSFLSAIEERQIKVNSLYVAPNAEDEMTQKEIREHEVLRYEVEKAGEVLGAMADGKSINCYPFPLCRMNVTLMKTHLASFSGLKEGVARIVRTFGDKLFAFKFPPRTAQKLQGFLDYC
jgi:nucleoporin NDC1